MESIYSKNILDYTTSINPSEINRSINITLKSKLSSEIEGKCIKEGYVRKDSIKILSRSVGEVLLSHFNGDILYHIRYNADICNPLEGMKITAKVVNINKMGILAEYIDGDVSPLMILLAKQHHLDNSLYDKLRVGEIITLSVLGKRFEYGDTQISIIGILDDEKNTHKIIRSDSNSTISSISSVEGDLDDPDMDEDEDEDEDEAVDALQPDTLIQSKLVSKPIIDQMVTPNIAVQSNQEATSSLNSNYDDGDTEDNMDDEDVEGEETNEDSPISNIESTKLSNLDIDLNIDEKSEVDLGSLSD